VYVRLEHYRKLGDLVREIESVAAFNDRVQIFGTLEETLGLDVLIGSRLDAFAKALHEDYRKRNTTGDAPPTSDAPESTAPAAKQRTAPAAKISPQANHPWHDLQEFMKMSNRFRADHTPVLLQLAGIRVQNDVAKVQALEFSGEEVEMLAQLEHRRYVIERFLTGVRHTTKRPNLEEWDKLDEGQREWNRREVAHIPAIMAHLGMQLSRVHKLQLYGESLVGVEAELNRALGDSQAMHWDVIVDIDDIKAMSFAFRALALPSRSIWLLSGSEPEEFFQRKSEAEIDKDPRLKVIHAAAGWARSSR